MKNLMTGILILAMVFVFAGCGSGQLSESYVKEDVIAKAEQVVTQLSNKEYQAVADMVREDLQEDLSAEVLEEALGQKIEAAGEFQEYTQTVTSGQQDKSAKEDYAIVVLVCQYENAKLTFTISFNEEMKLVGLYMR
ncbi:MAG: DUF3887 domain-containing protein [Lachnospiraceae bacterium]|nr:DUF3887 domain-containing protein [Lachnospiraceae bacterium]